MRDWRENIPNLSTSVVSFAQVRGSEMKIIFYESLSDRGFTQLYALPLNFTAV